MRKGLFTLILAIVSGACALMHAQTIVLSESFENGMPAGWTQETVIGSTSWTTEASAVGTLLYPEGTASGIGRAVLRNETGETQGFKTRLITPWMNLDTVFQPILRYYHAQVKWTGDIDTLRVLYRNSKTGDWQLLQEFTQAIQDWRKEELDLPQPSEEYQLCFEGTDNLGRGIVLDSVMVEQIYVNQASTQRLSKHPYLRFEQAKAIYELRRKKIKLHSVNDLEGLDCFDMKTLEKVAPYLNFDKKP